ncbi:MAG: DUF1552 domain-containing protein [Sandaracinaceae bacterium]
MSAVLRGPKFHRRTLLKGLGAAGAMLLAPTVRRSVAHADVGDPSFVVFYSPNGSLREDFGADGTETAFTLRSSLAALEPWRSRITVIHNINNMGYPAREVSHSNVSRILTCVTGTDPQVAAGPSIDYAIADAFGQSPIVLGVHPVGGGVSWHNKLSWAAAGVPTTPDLDSAAVFGRLFGGIADTPPSDGSADRWNRRQASILDTVRGDIATLRGRLGATGRSLLDVHVSSLRELEQGLQRSDVPAMMCDLGGLEGTLAGTLPFPSGSPSRKSAAYAPLLEAHGRLQMDMIATALACGRRRVATLVWQPCAMEGVNVEGTNGSVGHHDVSHWSSADPPPISTEQAREELRACDRFYARQYAYLLDKLDGLGILGDTFVPWVSDTRDSAHQQGQFQIVVGGGDTHGVRTGRFLRYAYSGGNNPKTVLSNRSFADLWVSTYRMMGLEPPRADGKQVFGPSEYCHGAGLEELVA